MLADQQTSDVRTDERVSTQIITALADVNGVDPVDFDTPLYDVVDPEALDALFRPRGPEQSTPVMGQVRFSVAGCEVVVDSDGNVAVTPLADNEQQDADDQGT